MLPAIGQLLPLAVAVAISSVPMMATILILLSPKRAQSAVPFLVGWVLGILVVVSLCTLFAQAVPASRSPRRPETVIGTLEILIGAGLIVIAIIEWRRARRNPTDAMPKWLNAVGTFGPFPAFAVAFALNLRPKGLLLAVAAGLVLRSEGLTLTESAVAILVYTAIGCSTVAVPIIVTLAAPERMEPRLVASKEWIGRNSGVVTALILLLIGVVIIGTGLGQL
jgi:hypothetical protein